jgi:hypothetical protein
MLTIYKSNHFLFLFYILHYCRPTGPSGLAQVQGKGGAVAAANQVPQGKAGNRRGFSIKGTNNNHPTTTGTPNSFAESDCIFG